MISFATIGRSWIVDEFIKGALNMTSMQLKGVYSRNIEDARAFAAKYSSSPQPYDNLEKLASSKNIDGVYVASPNSLHYKQCKLLLEGGKHVICEKAITVTPSQLKELQILANNNNLIYMEAIMIMHQPQLELLRSAMERIGRVYSARIDYSQTSSKYHSFLKGDNPNIFNPEFAAGCLMDMGIYCVYSTIALFGIPKDIITHMYKLDNGIDGCFSSIFIYDDKQVVLTSSKVCQGAIGSEILGEEGTVTVGLMSQLTDMKIRFRDGSEEFIFGDLQKNELMGHQAVSFYNYITDPIGTKSEYDYIKKISYDVCFTMEKMRHQGKLLFFDDQI